MTRERESLLRVTKRHDDPARSFPIRETASKQATQKRKKDKMDNPLPPPHTITNEICQDYKCYTPTPRSAWAADGGPLCAGLAEYLYDPANCDPGYWCGCSSSDPAACFPSNDVTTGSLWGGHFTTTNETSGDTLVLTGWFDGTGNQCPAGYYCPGRTEPNRCIDLCEPGKICPASDQMLDCPDGKFCPVGSTEPQTCRGLEICQGKGERRFGTAGASGVMLAYLVGCMVYLYYGRHVITQRAKRAKLAKLAKLASKKESEEEEESDTDRHNPDFSDSMYFVPAGVTSSKRRVSSISSPKTTIDIEFENLRLKLPNVGTIMRAVSGKLVHGKLTAGM